MYSKRTQGTDVEYGYEFPNATVERQEAPPQILCWCGNGGARGRCPRSGPRQPPHTKNTVFTTF